MFPLKSAKVIDMTGNLMTLLWMMIFSFCVWHSGSATAADSKPNLLVILVDDLGYGDLSCYGAKDLKSPHIDQLVSHGMKFTNFYANCPVCSPTRAALLSGRYQDRVGVPGVIRTRPEDNWGYLDPKAKLLPVVMQEAGYHTAIVGKWHLGLEEPNIPNERGFDHFHGFLGDMMDDYYQHRRHEINYMRVNKTEIDPQGHATDLFTEWANDYLKSRQRDQKPFFLYLAYNAPHTPIQPPDDWLQKVKQRESGISDKRARLVALIEHLDAGIGAVMQTLEETGLREKTIVVFSSDNGGQLAVGAKNGATRDGKGSVYQGGLKVPTSVVWPEHIEAGSMTEFKAMSMDILPTLMEAAGVSVPKGIEGRSFLPTLLGQSQSPLREKWYFVRREGGLRYGGKTIEALIWNEYKILQNSAFGPLEMYNLKTDPLEKEELSQKERKQFQTLAAELRRYIQEGGKVPWQRVE